MNIVVLGRTHAIHLRSAQNKRIRFEYTPTWNFPAANRPAIPSGRMPVLNVRGLTPSLIRFEYTPAWNFRCAKIPGRRVFKKNHSCQGQRKSISAWSCALRRMTMLACASLFFLSSCVDQITLKDQVLEAQAIAIDGKMIRSTGPFIVVEAKVRRIGDFRGFESDVPLSGQMRLLDENGQAYPIPELRQPRIYRALIPVNDPGFPIRPGRAYRLSVALPDGSTYESAPEILMPVPAIEQLSYYPYDFLQVRTGGFTEALPYLGFRVSGPLSIEDFQERARLRWEMLAHYKFTDNTKRVCYVPEQLRREQVLLYNGAQFNSSRLDAFALPGTLLDFRFAEGCYITVIQESLSSTAYQYFEQQRLLFERSGNMFDPPAGRIVSNFRNLANPKEQVYGYFYAAGQDTARLFIRPEEVGSPRAYCPEVPPPDPLRPTICNTCLFIGVTQKPPFWTE